MLKFLLLLTGVPALVTVVLAVISLTIQKHRKRVDLGAVGCLYIPALMLWAGVLAIIAVVSGDSSAFGFFYR